MQTQGNLPADISPLSLFIVLVAARQKLPRSRTLMIFTTLTVSSFVYPALRCPGNMFYFILRMEGLLILNSRCEIDNITCENILQVNPSIVTSRLKENIVGDSTLVNAYNAREILVVWFHNILPLPSVVLIVLKPTRRVFV